MYRIVEKRYTTEDGKEHIDILEYHDIEDPPPPNIIIEILEHMRDWFVAILLASVVSALIFFLCFLFYN